MTGLESRDRWLSRSLMKSWSELMGSETTEITLRSRVMRSPPFMMVGLQGAGKTTTSAKIAGKLKAKGRQPLTCGLRCLPAGSDRAAERSTDEKQGVEVFSMGDQKSPVDIAKAAD